MAQVFEEMRHREVLQQRRLAHVADGEVWTVHELQKLVSENLRQSEKDMVFNELITKRDTAVIYKIKADRPLMLDTR